MTMDIFESITCCVLALVTFAVFRKELLKVKDVFVSFWIPKKRQKGCDAKNKRQESNKENLPSQLPPNMDSAAKNGSTPLMTLENAANIKEVISFKETNSKITEEEEGIRIKSATLLPDVITFPPQKSFENYSSSKLTENVEHASEAKTIADPFPSFSDLLQSPPQPPRSPIDNLSSTKTEEVKNDDNTFTKTTTEIKHEVQGNTETSFMKKEQESVSKSVLTSDRIPSITSDVRDLNDIINATQKKLESFKNGFRSPTPDSGLSSTIYEVKKTEEKVSETKCNETISSITQPLFDLDSIFKDTMVSKNEDLAALNGSLGFNTNASETSCITEESPFGSTVITKKKKMFSSSSFYEEPQSIYPTVEEQVEMARKIAGSLADDTNKKSKGANMFYKRVKKSSKWIHEGPEPSDESGPGTPEIQGFEPPTPDPSQVPFKPSKGPSKLKLVMDSRHPLDLNALRSSGLAISEHNVVSPEVCHGLVKDLHSPVGKGAALFAKRKKKSEEWVVDEEKVKALLRENEKRSNIVPPITPYNQYSNFSRPDVKLIKTPWEAAMESPYGLCDAAFARVNPDHLANTVIKAADNKRRTSTPTKTWESPRQEGCMSPPVPVTPGAAQYDIYHAKAPKGWTGSRTGGDYSPAFGDIPVPAPSIPLETSNTQKTFSTLKKLSFHNFNTVPRLWKGASAH